MALKVLVWTLVGEGLLTDQAMTVYFNLKDSDFTRQGFAKVIARVISSRHWLYFRKNVTDELLAANINVLQGQLDGHCSHLMGLLTSRDMSGFVRSTLRTIRHRHLPVIIKQVLRGLSDLDQHRAAIFAHTLFKEKICLKDVVLHNTTIVPGYLAKCLAAIEPLTQPFDPDEQENKDMQLVELRVVRHITRALEQLDHFGMGIGRLPDSELDLKIKFLRTHFDAGLDAGLAFLDDYHRIFDKIDEAVQPLMGLISFDSGGQSDFYASWFPGLNNMLQRNSLIEQYIMVLERLKKEMADQEDKAAILRQNIESWLTPAVLTRASEESPHIGRFISDTLLDMLTSSYLFLNSLSRFPNWYHGLEASIFHSIEKKKAQAQRVIAAGKR